MIFESMDPYISARFVYALLSGLLCLKLTKEFHWSLVLAVFYTLIRGISGLHLESGLNTILFHIATMGALLYLLLFQGLLTFRYEHVKLGLSVLCLLNILASIVGIFYNTKLKFYSPWVSGLLLNPSMNAAFTVVLLPFVTGKLRWFCEAMALFFVFLVGSSTGLLAYGAVRGTWVWVNLGKRWSFTILPFLILFGVATIPNILGWDRWQIYHEYWNYWRYNVNPLFGSGVSSFFIYGPSVRIAVHQTSIWAWLHSDWFQCLFEQGLVGLSLWGITFCVAVKRAPLELKSSIMGWGATALFYFPAHSNLFSIVGATLGVMALRKDRDCEPSLS